MNQSTAASTASASLRRRRVYAVLAGGLVLGVGAAVTLAAWNDSEFAKSTFTAGSFNLEGSTTSAADGYADHDDSGSAAEIVFTAPFDDLAPADVVYAPFWVRLDDTTTTAATLTAAGVATDGGNVANLSYEIYSIAAAATCDATASTDSLVASGDSLSNLTAGNSVALAIGDGTDAGAPAQLCFVVTAGDDLVQGETAEAAWQFTATSD